WNESITQLKEDTKIALEQQATQEREVDSVMNFSTSNLFVTYGIIAINTIVFIIMITNGVSIFEPKTVDILRWGANYGPLTLGGDWWRLITSFFIHIGFIHLLLNMYAFYMIGVYLEPLLGKSRFIIAYLCAGIISSLASIWWHKEPIAS